MQGLFLITYQCCTSSKKFDKLHIVVCTYKTIKMCYICNRETCICLSGRPTTKIVNQYIKRLNIILDKHSLVLPKVEVDNILQERDILNDWLEHKPVCDIKMTILKCTKIIYKYIF